MTQFKKPFRGIRWKKRFVARIEKRREKSKDETDDSGTNVKIPPNNLTLLPAVLSPSLFPRSEKFGARKKFAQAIY